MIHGKKAVKKTRREGYNIPGPDGKTLRRYKKTTYWECHLDPVKGVFLKQTQLSFSRTTPVRVQGGGDTGRDTENVLFSSTTVGQEDTDICTSKKEENNVAGINV